MKIVFRADASLTIGNGHVMRCASLAHALRAQGAQCVFVCANETGHLNAYLHAQGFDVQAFQPSAQDTRVNAESLLPNWLTDAQATLTAIQHQHIDCLVVDHYGLDEQWENLMFPHAKQILVIDDLANRTHQCTWLLDSNPGRNAADYAALTSSNCHTLIGPQYALIRDEIRQFHTKANKRHDSSLPLKILVTLGGVDKDNLTTQVLNSLNQFDSDVPLDIQVVMGPFAPWVDDVKKASQSMRWPTRVTQNPANFVELMCTHDIALGAAGTSALERCCVGLPSINFVLAPNQQLSATALHNQDAAGLVELDQEWQDTLHLQLRNLLNQDNHHAMQQACLRITDGAGAQRVAQEIMHA
jgi:UDP-2,4-diacetamido-2,4,6-trideoxy-beta-L-altropyranose hydrolase